MVNLERPLVPILMLIVGLSVSACDKGEAGDSNEDAPAAEGEAASKDAKAEEQGAGEPAAAASPFSFNVEASNGRSWSDASPKARVKKARADYLQVGATDFSLRIMADDLPPTGTAESSDLNGNNTYLHFKTEIDGKKMMIGCHPNKKAVTGTLNRTKLDENIVEGSFEFELVECNDYMTGKPVAYEGVPFTAKGSFSLPLSK